MGQQKNGESVFTSGYQAGSATMAPPRRDGKKSRPATTTGPKITHDQIARRAHEIWVKQGCKHGQDKDHWFEAERQLKAELAGK